MSSKSSKGGAGTGMPIKPATTAYGYFQSEQHSKCKHEFEGLSLGQTGAEISRRWHALDQRGRAKFEEMAANDRARYHRECDARDEEVAAQQAANREARFAEPASKGYMRQRATPEHKKERRVTREENVSEQQLEVRRLAKEKREKVKAARLEAEAESSRQKETIAAAAAAMARKRIKYILRQSDIFATHFGVTLSESEDEGDDGDGDEGEVDGAREGLAGSGSPSKRRRPQEDACESQEADVTKAEESAPTYLMQQPPCITGGKLRAYQLEGLNWMINLQAQGTNGILADEMGLGKTLQSISILAYMRDFRKVNSPHLVLLPKSVLGNWEREFARFCPIIRTLRLSGTKDERAATIRDHIRAGQKEEERSWDVLITTYEVANIEKTTLNKIGWRYLIIDEAHRLKNESSMLSLTVRELTTQYRLLLTGTPLQNNLHELWALLNFLLPAVFQDSDAFSKVFDLNVDDAAKKQNMIKQLHKILRPFMLRRLKKEVEKSLPPKEETILFTGMTEMQRKVYKGVLMRDIDAVNGANVARTAILNIVMQLRKCCNHPYLFPNTEDRDLDPHGEHLVENCGKMILLDRLLKRLKEMGHRVLIFSQMTRMIDILEDLMHMRDYEYCRIDGNTAHDTRQDLIEDYNKPGSSKFAFLLSTRAGGLGINLQSADTCILYDSDWNPQADLQAQDRCHRIGQTKTVKVYRLVTEDTIEEKVVERAQQKLKLDAMVVQRGMLQGEKKLEKDELLAAIRFGADAVFRCKGTVMMSDSDLDAVLQRGAKKTAELQAQLNVADKGDMLDFRFDQGPGIQSFEGIDYGDRKLRDQMRAGFIDIGRRERKPAAVKAYAPAPLRVEPKKTTVRLPKDLELPQMKDFQMFDRDRLVELQNELQDKFKELRDSGADIPSKSQELTEVLLAADKARERAELLAGGFSHWTRAQYHGFVDGLAVFGRKRLDLIAPMVGRPLEEVRRYSEAFWKRGPTNFSVDTWRRIRTRVEIRERKLAEIDRHMDCTKELVQGVEDPWCRMEVRINQRQAGGGGMQLQKEWTKDEDRHLLCLVHLYGWGNWEKIRACIMASPRFKFDYYLRSLSESTLAKHCEQLAKSADKYLQDRQERNRKEAKRETEELAGLRRDEAMAEREDGEYKIRIGAIDEMLGRAELELQEAESGRKNLEVIKAGLKSGLVTFENPKLATLFGACAAAGIGTSGLAIKPLKKGATPPPSSASSPASSVDEGQVKCQASSGSAGKKQGTPGPVSASKKSQRKSGSGGNNSNNSSSSSSGNGVGVDSNGGGGSGGATGGARGSTGATAKKKSGGCGTPTANGSAGAGSGEQKAKGGNKSGEGSGGKSGGSTDGSAGGVDGVAGAGSSAAAGGKANSKPTVKPVAKSSGGGETSKSPKSKTPVKVLGKPGLAVPTMLYPELARIIDSGGLTSKEEMLQVIQRKHPSFTQVSIGKTLSLLGEKTSRGSKWQLLEAGKKYLEMPVHQGSVPEEVAVMAAAAAKRKSSGSGSGSTPEQSPTPKKAKKTSTGSKGKAETVRTPIVSTGTGKGSSSSQQSSANGANGESSGNPTSKKRRASKGSQQEASAGGGGGGSGAKGVGQGGRGENGSQSKTSAPSKRGFMAFCRANRTKVQQEVAGGSKTETVERLLYLWGRLSPSEVERWNSGELPAVGGGRG